VVATQGEFSHFQLIRDAHEKYIYTQQHPSIY